MPVNSWPTWDCTGVDWGCAGIGWAITTGVLGSSRIVITVAGGGETGTTKDSDTTSSMDSDMTSSVICWDLTTVFSNSFNSAV